MKRVAGFALFWVAVGILLMMILQNVWVGIMLMLLCTILAYSLFCC